MKDELLKNILNNMDGFIKHNNIIITKLDKDDVWLEVSLNKNSMNPYNIAHGGLIYTMADTAMGLLIRNTLENNYVTVNSQIDFLKPGNSKKLIAKAKIIKNGKRIIFAKAEIMDEEKNIIATCRGTYICIN